MGVVLAVMPPRFFIGIASRWGTEEAMDWIASGDKEGKSLKPSRPSGLDGLGLVVGVGEEEAGNMQVPNISIKKRVDQQVQAAKQRTPR